MKTQSIFDLQFVIYDARYEITNYYEVEQSQFTTLLRLVYDYLFRVFPC